YVVLRIDAGSRHLAGDPGFAAGRIIGQGSGPEGIDSETRRPTVVVRPGHIHHRGPEVDRAYRRQDTAVLSDSHWTLLATSLRLRAQSASGFRLEKRVVNHGERALNSAKQSTVGARHRPWKGPPSRP